MWRTFTQTHSTHKVISKCLMVSYYSIIQICSCRCSQHSGGDIDLCSPRVIPSLSCSHTFLCPLNLPPNRFPSQISALPPSPSSFCAKSLSSQLTEEMTAYKQQVSREVPVAQYLLGHASVHLTFLPLTIATDGVSVVSDQASKSWSFHWDIFRHVCHDVLCSCLSPSPLIIADQFPPKRLLCTAMLRAWLFK